MRKYIMIFAVALVVIMTALPALAEVELKYGGQFRARFESENNVFDGTEQPFAVNANGVPTYNSNDNRVFFDQRMRMFFNFVASKNLNVMARFEMGDTQWGWGNSNAGVRANANSGGNVGADTVGIEMKNIFMQFNIPETPSTVVVGIQPINILDDWMLSDDLAGAVVTTKLDPFKLTLGYVAAQKGWERSTAAAVPALPAENEIRFAGWKYNIDDMIVGLDYKQGPWKASLNFVWQDGHKTDASIDPQTLNSPIGGVYLGNGIQGAAFSQSLFLVNQLDINDDTGVITNNGTRIDSNNLFNVGFNIGYKVDWLSAYVNFMKNFGGVDFVQRDAGGHVISKTSTDYEGWMIDAGVTYFCGPFTASIGGFYTSGPKITNLNDPNFYSTFAGLSSKNVDWFVQPLGTSKYTSEIIGGGILGDDAYAYRGYSSNVSAANMGQAAGLGTVYWRGLQNPTNIWNVNVGGSWQIGPSTKLTGTYYYWGTPEAVPVAFSYVTGLYSEKSSSIGHEFNVYLDQKIVDNLTLTLVGAYLFANDAFAPLTVPNLVGVNNINTVVFTGGVPIDAHGIAKIHADDAFELGAQLMWNW